MKKLQNILIFSFLLLGQIVLAQEKLPDFQLSPEEKELLDANGKVVRESREYLDWNNLLCKGVVELIKVDGEIEFNHVGPWYHYYNDGSLKEIYVFDDKGNLMKYDYYEENGFHSYSCTYTVKQVEDKKYRIEHLKLYYPSGILKEEGYRYNTIEFKNGAIRVSSPRKIGIWTFYKESGELYRQGVERQKLAKKLELIN